MMSVRTCNRACEHADCSVFVSSPGTRSSSIVVAPRRLRTAPRSCITHKLALPSTSRQKFVMEPEKKKSSHDGEATGQYFMKMKYTGTVYTIPGERGCWRGVMRMRSSYGACGLFLNLKCVSQGGCRRATFGVGYVLTRELGALDSGFTFDRLVMTGSTVQFVTNSPQGF